VKTMPIFILEIFLGKLTIFDRLVIFLIFVFDSLVIKKNIFQ